MDLSKEENELISKMETMGAKTDGVFFIITNKKTLYDFINVNYEIFIEASKEVLPTLKQREFCEDLINNGAEYSSDAFKSMRNADLFIKKNIQFKNRLNGLYFEQSDILNH